MSRAPVRGRVKTRLIPSLGATRATRVYLQLLRATLAQVAGAANFDIQIWGAPSSGHIEFLRLSHRYGYRRHVQPPGGLGQKMSAIFSQLLRHYRGVVIVGADCPDIDIDLIRQCHSELERHADLFIGATEDGGYALIGLKQVQPALFRAMPWGTDRVFKLTKRRAQQLGLLTSTRQGLWDVDTVADYRRWLRQRRDQGKAWVV